MKKVALPDIKFAVQVEPATKEKPALIEQINAAQQLLLIVSAPPTGQTFSITDIRDRMSLVKKLEKAKGTSVLLENDEHTTLLAALNGAAWLGFSLNAVALVDAVEKAADVEVKENRAARRKKEKRGN